MSEDTLKITAKAEGKIRQLQMNDQMAQLLLQQYVQACLDMLTPEGDKSNWTLDMSDMTFHRVKE